MKKQSIFPQTCYILDSYWLSLELATSERANLPPLKKQRGQRGNKGDPPNFFQSDRSKNGPRGNTLRTTQIDCFSIVLVVRVCSFTIYDFRILWCLIFVLHTFCSNFCCDSQCINRVNSHCDQSIIIECYIYFIRKCMLGKEMQN